MLFMKCALCLVISTNVFHNKIALSSLSCVHIYQCFIKMKYMYINYRYVSYYMGEQYFFVNLNYVNNNTAII